MNDSPINNGDPTGGGAGAPGGAGAHAGPGAQAGAGAPAGPAAAGRHGLPGTRRWPLPGSPAIWLSGAALVLALLALIIVVVTGGGDDQQRTGAGNNVGPSIPTEPRSADPVPSTSEPEPTTPPSPSEPPAAGSTKCPTATVTVRDADGLKAALDQAEPGASIWLEDGVYQDKFVAKTPGTAEQPIYLCGGAGAVLDGGSVTGGYALHLDGASYWRVIGFTIRNGQKGLMADKVQRVVIQGLTVEQIGDEAIHLRNFSSDNVVQGNTVRDTGKRRDKFGEGIYIGTAESNWCTISGCQPDHSDRNMVRNNTISATTAEAIDIKEGTTGGWVIGNTFDGGSLSGSHSDSWVDVKGNGWLIQGNKGRNALTDGFQTHEVVDGWGKGNVFKGNIAEVNGPGYGFNFAPANDNKVSCDNKVVKAGKGLSNVKCS
jgi:hypothetical protein